MVELIRPKLLQLMNFLETNKKGNQPIHARRGKVPPMSHKPRPRQQLKIRPEPSPKQRLPKLNSLDSSELTQYMSCGGIKLTTRSNISLHPRRIKKPSSPLQNPQASTAPSRPFLPLRPFPSSSPFLSVGLIPLQSQFPLRHSRQKQNPQELRYIHRLLKIEKEELILSKHKKKQKQAFYLSLKMYVSLQLCQEERQYPSPHSHLLLPLGQTHIEEKSWYVVDKINCSSLQNLFDQFGQIPSRLTRKYLKQLTGVLYHLHQQGFTHNRVNPETVMHDEEGKVLLDYLASSNGPLSQKERMKHLYYFPPEALLSRNYYQSQKNDVWALGCLALQMQMEGPLLNSSMHPYNRNAEGSMSESTTTLKKVQQLINTLGLDPVPKEKQQLTVLCMEFVSLCLAINIERRASLSQLLTHPYIAA